MIRDFALGSQSPAYRLFDLGRSTKMPHSPNISRMFRLLRLVRSPSGRTEWLASRQSGEYSDLTDPSSRRKRYPLAAKRPVPRVRMSCSAPRSLDCREIPKHVKDVRLSRYLVDKPDWRERTARQRRGQCPGFSLEGQKQSGFEVAIRRMLNDHKPKALRMRT